MAYNYSLLYNNVYNSSSLNHTCNKILWYLKGDECPSCGDCSDGLNCDRVPINKDDELYIVGDNHYIDTCSYLEGNRKILKICLYNNFINIIADNNHNTVQLGDPLYINGDNKYIKTDISGDKLNISFDNSIILDNGIYFEDGNGNDRLVRLDQTIEFKSSDNTTFGVNLDTSQNIFNLENKGYFNVFDEKGGVANIKSGEASNQEQKKLNIVGDNKHIKTDLSGQTLSISLHDGSGSFGSKGINFHDSLNNTLVKLGENIEFKSSDNTTFSVNLDTSQNIFNLENKGYFNVFDEKGSVANIKSGEASNQEQKKLNIVGDNKHIKTDLSGQTLSISLHDGSGSITNKGLMISAQKTNASNTGPNYFCVLNDKPSQDGFESTPPSLQFKAGVAIETLMSYTPVSAGGVPSGDSSGNNCSIEFNLLYNTNDFVITDKLNLSPVSLQDNYKYIGINGSTLLGTIFNFSLFTTKYKGIPFVIKGDVSSEISYYLDNFLENTPNEFCKFEIDKTRFNSTNGSSMRNISISTLLHPPISNSLPSSSDIIYQIIAEIYGTSSIATSTIVIAQGIVKTDREMISSNTIAQINLNHDYHYIRIKYVLHNLNSASLNLADYTQIINNQTRLVITCLDNLTPIVGLGASNTDTNYNIHPIPT